MTTRTTTSSDGLEEQKPLQTRWRTKQGRRTLAARNSLICTPRGERPTAELQVILLLLHEIRNDFGQLVPSNVLLSLSRDLSQAG